MADPKDLAKKAEEELAEKQQGGLGAKIKSVQLNTEGSFIADHTVTADETLSHIALKYYGDAGREAWMKIYEANKAVIGDNPALLKPGIILKIPAK